METGGGEVVEEVKLSHFSVEVTLRLVCLRPMLGGWSNVLLV